MQQAAQVKRTITLSMPHQSLMQHVPAFHASTSASPMVSWKMSALGIASLGAQDFELEACPYALVDTPSSSASLPGPATIVPGPPMADHHATIAQTLGTCHQADALLDAHASSPSQLDETRHDRSAREFKNSGSIVASTVETQEKPDHLPVLASLIVAQSAKKRSNGKPPKVFDLLGRSQDNASTDKSSVELEVGNLNSLLFTAEELFQRLDVELANAGVPVRARDDFIKVRRTLCVQRVFIQGLYGQFRRRRLTTSSCIVAYSSSTGKGACLELSR